MNNEETLHQNVQTPPAAQPKKVTAPQQIHTGWKRVAIGGISGILIGSAAAYSVSKWNAAQAAADSAADANNPTTDEHAMAHNVTDDMTFAEAFAAARDEVGAGGVFTWHGGVYGTFYADEWNAMSADEQKAYFDSINANAIEPRAYTAAHHDAEAPQEVHVYHHTADDSEIRVINVEQVQNTDGTVTNVATIEAGGHKGVVMGGEEPEMAIIDIDDSGSLTEPDIIIDLSTGASTTVGEYVAQVEAQQNHPDYTHAAYEQGEAAPVDDTPVPETYNSTIEPTTEPGFNDPGADMAIDADMAINVDMAIDVDVHFV